MPPRPTPTPTSTPKSTPRSTPKSTPTSKRRPTKPKPTRRPTTTPPTWIAEKHVIFVAPDGSRRAGRIAVAQPTASFGGSFGCVVVLEHADAHATRHRPIFGEGSLQALLLGLRFLGFELHGYLARGGRVLEPDSDDDVALEHSFGPLLPSPD